MLIGHTFLLIWNNLFIVEEGKAYLGWERIKDMLRNEEHKRLSTDLINPAGDSDSRTALSKLKVRIKNNFRFRRISYFYVKTHFCGFFGCGYGIIYIFLNRSHFF